MGRPRILDLKIMTKIASKRGKRDLNDINRLVSKKAAKLNISAEAALILLAKEQGIGTANFQRSLDQSKQAEVRNALPSLLSSAPSVPRPNENGRPSHRRARSANRSNLKFAIEYLIQDPELRERCADILLARANFDRPINQATLILEDRIRRKSQPNRRIVGEQLVGYAFNEDLAKTVLRVASNEPDDQRGFTQILRGIVPAFRNKTHHHILNSFSREDAMRVSGFIDVLLRIVDNSTLNSPIP